MGAWTPGPLKAVTASCCPNNCTSMLHDYHIFIIIIEGLGNLGARRAFLRKTCIEINELRVSKYLCHPFGTARVIMKFMSDERSKLRENNHIIVLFRFVSTQP